MDNRPNLLFIMTDQQQAGMMSCTGNAYVNTPNLDRLARNGVRFERAYCTNPVCGPSRFSMATGLYPSRIGMEDNEGHDRQHFPREIMDHTMGNLLRQSGYRTMYGGKIHLSGPQGEHNDIELYGFELLTKNAREDLAHSCADFLRQSHEQPFLLVASFINPHDICYMAINSYNEHLGKPPVGGEAWECLKEALQIPKDLDEEQFFANWCPPLPDNLEVPEHELTAMMALKPEFMHFVRSNWTERDWRLHRWAYRRLTERVDAQIGVVLDALRASGLEDNTLVVFTSDHGDMDGSHRQEHKSNLYEESIRVPLIVSGPGIQKGQVNDTHLVSTGLDILPTLCEAANVEKHAALEGRSVLGIAKGMEVTEWRDHLVVETHLARLVLMGRWKYMAGWNGPHSGEQCMYCKHTSRVYEPSVREMLIDLENDPGEMVNRAEDNSCADHILKGRNVLSARQHKSGYSLDQHYAIDGV